jgi:hypothetical protein
MAMEAGNAEWPENQSRSAADYSRRAGIERLSNTCDIPRPMRDDFKEALIMPMF